jgi:FAD dependent oxidoreductase TIGR03364
LRRHSDVAIVGAGIIGLAHALAAARRGLTVTVFERDAHANGASVRNFGLGLVVGQAPGEMQALALRSRAIWLDVLGACNSWHRAGGSLVVARNAQELDVLEEFQARRGEAYGTRLAGVGELTRWGLYGFGALASPHEIALEARVAVPALARWLAEAHGVQFVWNTLVHEVEGSVLATTAGRFEAGRTIVCSGHDCQTLFAGSFDGLGIGRCSLQMLRLADPGVKLKHSLMTGLSTLHYPAFADCTSLQPLREKVCQITPELIEHGIHLIVQQLGNGELIVGDSHHYGLTPTPFCGETIDRALLQLAQDLLQRPLVVRERWQGVYATGARPYEILSPATNVQVVMMTAGIGMSIGFALAERQFAA